MQAKKKGVQTRRQITCIASAESHVCCRYRYCYWYCYYCCHCATPARQCFSARCVQSRARRSVAQARPGFAVLSAQTRSSAQGHGACYLFFVRLLTRPYARWLASLARSYPAAPRHRKAYRESNRPPALPLQPPASISKRASTASTTPFAPRPRSTWPRLCSSASSSTAPS
jgi:hypothetical protein